MKIVCGGQTGVDRAALDAARELGILYGGWCPKGGWAEDLPDPPGLLAIYAELRPTPSPDPAVRTQWNVRDSDRTLIITGNDGSVGLPGTALTADYAQQIGRPLLRVRISDDHVAEQIVAWLASTPDTLVLNIAGPRESEIPGIYAAARRLLEGAFRQAVRPETE